MLLMKVAHGRTGRLGVLEIEKDLADGTLDLHVGIKHNRIGFSVTQPDGQGQFQGTTPGLVKDTSLRTGAYDEGFSF